MFLLIYISNPLKTGFNKQLWLLNNYLFILFPAHSTFDIQIWMGNKFISNPHL